jgi:uncharacterized coiled-coil protein SlyX
MTRGDWIQTAVLVLTGAGMLLAGDNFILSSNQETREMLTAQINHRWEQFAEMHDSEIDRISRLEQHEADDERTIATFTGDINQLTKAIADLASQVAALKQAEADRRR